MQSGFRRLLAKWTTIALFALLIASFALWGIGDIFRGGGGSTAVIQVGEAEITETEFARTFQREFNRVRQQLGGELDLETARNMGLVDQIVRQAITRKLFSRQAGEMGLVVGEPQIVQQIRRQPAFQNSLGQFDRRSFETALRRGGMSEAQYVELIRDDIQRQQLVEAATGALRVPDPLARALFSYRNERRVATYAAIPRDRFQVPDPNESALRSYYEEHGDAFMAPAHREITLIDIRVRAFTDEVKVDEDALRDAYEARKGQFGEPARRRLAQMIFDDRGTAATAAQRARGGADFDAVARELTGEAAIDLGMNTREDLLPALREPVFALDAGEVSAPIESALGWHVVKVSEVQEAVEPSFAAVRDELRRELARDKAVDSLVALANELDDSLAGGASLEQAADGLGLNVRHIPAVTRAGETPAGEPVADLPQQEAFLEAAFNTPEGQQSLLQETDAGGYFVLRVDGVTPPRRMPFEEVRGQVRERYLRDQRQGRARDLAARIAEAVEAGTPLAQAARTNGLEVATSRPLARSGNRDAAPAERAIAGRIFDVGPDAPVTAETDTGMVVATLDEVQAPDPSSRPAELRSLRQSLDSAMENDVLAQFAEALRQSHEVRVNQTRLDQIVNRFQ